MFEYKHRITLNDNSITYLEGEDYYNDKKVFFEHHYSRLQALCNEICLKGFPIEIENLFDKKTITINTSVEFNEWLKTNQPLKECDCKK